MLIRREDRELIHNLALLGALFGACIGVFVTIHLSNQAREQYKQHAEYQETNAALAKLTTSSTSPEQPIVDEDILQQVQEHIQQEQSENPEDSEKSFWLDLPQWGFWGICTGSGLLGMIAGFSGIWLTGWTGSLLVYGLIRIFYRFIRRVAPDSAAARLTQQSCEQTDHPAFARDRQRVFPVLIKLTFLLLLVLGVLAVVVWIVTGL